MARKRTSSSRKTSSKKVTSVKSNNSGNSATAARNAALREAAEKERVRQARKSAIREAISAKQAELNTKNSVKSQKEFELTQLKKDLADCKTLIAGLSGAISTINSGVQQVRQGKADLALNYVSSSSTTKGNQIDGECGNIESQVNRLNNVQAEASRLMVVINTKIKKLEEEIRKLEQEISNLQADISRLNSELASI